MKKEQSIENARTLLRQTELGVLSTHSKSNSGYPFGSVSTYMSTINGDVVFYISDLAQHTKNLLANPRMCLTVASDIAQTNSQQQDPNDGARLSLLGQATILDETEQSVTEERFFTLYPDSRNYQNTHGFLFFKLTVERARYIGGFGDIHWISQQQWTLQTPQWLTQEQSIIAHMNTDHQDAMQTICQHVYGITSQKIQMLSLHSDGFFVRVNKSKPFFIPFEKPAFDQQSIRQQLINLTQSARHALQVKS